LTCNLCHPDQDKSDGIPEGMKVLDRDGFSNTSDDMKTLVYLDKTCNACPSQWEGRTYENDTVYIRYRFGTLRVDVNDKTVYSKELGSGLDGRILRPIMLKHLKKAGIVTTDKRTVYTETRF